MVSWLVGDAACKIDLEEGNYHRKRIRTPVFTEDANDNQEPKKESKSAYETMFGKTGLIES